MVIFPSFAWLVSLFPRSTITCLGLALLSSEVELSLMPLLVIPSRQYMQGQWWLLIAQYW